MLAIIDVGNTNIKIGLFNKKDVIKKTIRFLTSKDSLNEIKVFFENNLVSNIFIGSVVLNFEKILLSFLKENFPLIKTILLTKKFFFNNCENDGWNVNKKQVGLDIIAYSYYIGQISDSGLGISFGTLTFACAVENKKLKGAVIAPRFSTAPFDEIKSVSLINSFKIDYQLGKVFGNDTNAAVSSGLLHYFMGFIESLTIQAKNDYGIKKVYVTGGNARFIRSLKCNIKFEFDSFIILKGYYLISKKYQQVFKTNKN